jgi:hypothetical protein
MAKRSWRGSELATEADLERATFARYLRPRSAKLLKSLAAARSKLRYAQGGFYETMRNKRRSKRIRQLTGNTESPARGVWILCQH